MPEIKDIKCKCCKCHDSFDGCTAFDCQYDFEISIQKVKETAQEYGMSVDTIMALLMTAANKNEVTSDEETSLPDDFNPFYDSHFMVCSDDENGSEPRRLVEMLPDDLKRLRAEIEAVLNIQEG